MSTDGGEDEGEGGRRNDTPPLDIHTATNAEQETEHDNIITNSELAISPGESFKNLSNLSHSLLASSRQSTNPTLSLQPQVDYQQHQNEDATLYSNDRESSDDENISRESGADAEQTEKDDSLQHSSGSEELPLPQQAKELEDNSAEEMVITKDYMSESLVSTYLLIQCRNEIDLTCINAAKTNSQRLQAVIGDLPTTSQLPPSNENSANVSEDAVPLFTMDDDLPGEENKQDVSPTQFSAMLSLNFDKEQSTAKSSPGHSRESVNSNESSNVKDEVNVKITSSENLDQADKHREPGLVAVAGTPPTLDGNLPNRSTVVKTGEIVYGIKRPKICNSIARCSPYQTEFNIPKFNASNNVTVESQLHPQGLDQDCKDRKVTLTGTVHLPKDTKRSTSCVCTLSVYIYEGAVSARKCIGKQSTSRELSDDERQSLTVSMAVHNVASQSDIIFSKRYPDKLLVKVVAEVKLHDN